MHGLNAPRQGRHTRQLREDSPKAEVCTTGGDAPHFDVVSFLKMLLQVDILALVFGDMLFKCQAAVKGNTKIH